VAAVFIWLSTGGVLKHSDDLSALMTFPASAHQSPVLHSGNAVQSSDDDDCAACRWALTSSDMLVAPPIRPAMPYFRLALQQTLPASAHTAPILHANLRAPPVVAA
jgi:hypothetical protein